MSRAGTYFRTGKAFVDKLSGEKPHSSISDWVEVLSSDRYDETSLDGIPELVESINLQDRDGVGTTEAARAIRKKLKYGNVHRQLRALVILRALTENAGERFKYGWANAQLLERLQAMATDSLLDPKVKKQLIMVFHAWSIQYKDEPRMSTVAGLYRQHSGAARRPGHGASASIGSRDSIKPASSTTSPSAGGFSNSNPFYDHSWEPDAAARAGAPVTDRAAAKADADQRRREREERQALERREAEIERRERDLKRKQEMAEVETRRKREAEDEAARRKRAKEAKKLRKYEPRRPKFDFEKEKPKVMTAVASATQAATNLVNSCRHINRETENITESPRVQENLDKAKAARRVIVRYIQLVGDEEYLGTLLDANEKIVEAIKLYDKLSKPAALDSDSEPEDPRARSDAEQVGRIRARLAAQHLEDQRTGELQQLQVQQKAESQRQAARRAAKAPVTDATSTQPNLLYDDLKDLDFGSILSNPRAARLQAPMRPDSDSGSYDGGSLSDFSDYDSSEDEYRAAHAAHVKSHSRKSSRSYDYAGSSRHPDTSTYAALEDEQAGAGLMDPNDTFGDPFADENETLGQSRRRLEHVEI